MYQIRINALEGGGYEMQVGCQRFFYGTHAAMMTELSNFMEHPQIVERQYNHFKAQISDAKSQTGPLGEHRLGDVREFPPFTPPYGTLVNNPLPGFEYRAPIDGIRFTHSPNTVSDPGATTNAGYPGNMTAADVVRNIAGAIRP